MFSYVRPSQSKVRCLKPRMIHALQRFVRERCSKGGEIPNIGWPQLQQQRSVSRQWTKEEGRSEVTHTILERDMHTQTQTFIYTHKNTHPHTHKYPPHTYFSMFVWYDINSKYVVWEVNYSFTCLKIPRRNEGNAVPVMFRRSQLSTKSRLFFCHFKLSSAGDNYIPYLILTGRE